MQRDLSPLRRAIHHQNHIANFGGLQRSSRDARFLHEKSDFNQCGKIKSSAHAPEFPNLRHQFLLALKPVPVGRRSQPGNPPLSQRRGSVSPQ